MEMKKPRLSGVGPPSGQPIESEAKRSAMSSCGLDGSTRLECRGRQVSDVIYDLKIPYISLHRRPGLSIRLKGAAVLSGVRDRIRIPRP